MSSIKQHPNEILFSFLRQLIPNNNREWFKSHRELYDAAWAQFNVLVENVIAAISEFDESIAGLTPKDCTYRIYRDIRFSPDKTPYKGHLGAYMNYYGKKAYWGGYYLQIEPEQVMLASGVWWLPTKEMQHLRQSVSDQMTDFVRLVEKPELKKLVPQIGQEHYKRIPNGLPKDSPHPEYLTCKDYAMSCMLKPEELCSDDYAQRIAHVFRVMKPLNDFLSENILINMEEMETMKSVVKFV